MNDLTIRWIGQGGFLLSDGDKTVCIDPYLSDVVNRVAGRPRMLPPPFEPEALECHAVICTHDHLDHVDVDAIPLMQKDDVTFLAPTHARETLLSCGVTEYIPFDEGSIFRLGGFELKAVYARHSVPAVGVMIRHGGICIYLSGDTEYDDRLRTLADENPDIMIVCINGRLGNMNAAEAAELTRAISPRLGIPTHYGMFESNTADPWEYLSRIDSGFEMEYDKKYNVKELLKNV